MILSAFQIDSSPTIVLIVLLICYESNIYYSLEEKKSNFYQIINYDYYFLFLFFLIYFYLQLPHKIYYFDSDLN